jgi:hypothetical protein
MLLQTSLGRSKLDPGPQLFGETPDGSEWQSLQKPGASENWLCLKIDENCVYIMIHGLFFFQKMMIAIGFGCNDTIFRQTQLGSCSSRMPNLDGFL